MTSLSFQMTSLQQRKLPSTFSLKPLQCYWICRIWPHYTQNAMATSFFGKAYEPTGQTAPFDLACSVLLERFWASLVKRPRWDRRYLSELKLIQKLRCRVCVSPSELDWLVWSIVKKSGLSAARMRKIWLELFSFNQTISSYLRAFS